MLRSFDRGICALRGVFAYDPDPECILRIQVEKSTHFVDLPGGALHKGDPIIHLHLWNEHMPPMPLSGQDLAWANRTWRQFSASLERLARAVECSPRLAKARALGGAQSLFTLQGGPSSGARLMRRVGFTVVPYYKPWGDFGEWIENTYSWWLMWAYNPGSMRSRDYRGVERTEIWMSIPELLRRFGSGREAVKPVSRREPLEVNKSGSPRFTPRMG